MKYSPTEKELTSIKSMINTAVTGSDYFADEFPKWMRPVSKLFSLAFILLFLFLMAPYFLIKRKVPNSYQTLKADLIATWHSESSIVALNKLREAHTLLVKHADRVMLGGYKIEPYGKFNFYDYANVSKLLYYWEIQHNYYTEALEICDEMLSPGENSKNISRIYADWIIYKGRALKLSEGALVAQEYLLRHIDQNNEKCRVKEYLHKLREESEV